MEAHSGMDNTKMVKANYNSLSPNLLFEQLFYYTQNVKKFMYNK